MNDLEYLLQNAPEFVEFTNYELDLLSSAMVVRDYPDGHEFVHEDRWGHELYLLIDGEAEMSHRRVSDRGTVKLKRIVPGELFGLLSLIDHGRRYASIRADGPVRVASLPQSAVALLFESNSPLPHRFQHVIARQLARDYRAVLAHLQETV